MATVKVFPPVNINTYNVVEDATPVDPSDLAGGVGQMTLVIPETTETKGLLNYDVRLNVLTQGETTGTVRSLSATDGDATLNADSRLGQLNVERTASPVNATLSGAMYYYLGLADITTGIFIDDEIFDLPVVFPGWSGNVWDNLKKIAVSLQIEISLVSNNVVVRPIRQRTAENYRDASRGWALDTSQLARSVQIYYYENEFLNGALAYPAGGWNDDVPIYSVESGQTLQFSIPLSRLDDDLGTGYLASLASVQQPTAVDFVTANYAASSVYAVSGSDGLGITASAWTALGGSLTVAISEDSRSLDVTVTGPDWEDYSPYSIAMAAGVSNRYSSLRLVGNGVFSTRGRLTLNTAVNHDVITEEVGAIVENEFISSIQQAYDIGAWALKAWGGPRYTIDVSTNGVNRLGDNGSYRYPTIAEFNAMYAGDDIADFNLLWAGMTIEEFNEYMTQLVQNDFENQAFGNIAGARVRFEDAIFRITTARNSSGGITYSATEDTTVEDFNRVWGGDGPIQYNYIKNPSGRVSLTNYVGYTGSTTLSAGNYTQHVTTGTGAVYSSGVSVETKTVGVDLEPNTQYTLSADIQAVNGHSVAVLALGTGVVGVTVASAPVAVGAMTRASVTFTTGASGTVAFAVMNATSRVAGSTLRFKNVRLTSGAASNATVYFDGNDTFWSWSGTPNNSISVGPRSGGATIADFNREWSDYDLADFTISPLRRRNV